MEEFDRHIKSKIDALHEVPGVKFDEERVWKRIRAIRGKGLYFGLSMIIILASVMIIFLPKKESQRKVATYIEVKEMIPQVLIDSTITQASAENPFKNHSVEAADSSRDSKRKSREELKSGMNKSTPIFLAKKQVKRQNIYSPDLVDPLENERKRETSMSLGKKSQTVGITQLKEITNHFSITYGIQFNRRLNQRLGLSEGVIMPIENKNVQFSIGLRYNIFKRERQFNPYLYTGLTNSFLSPSNTATFEYNLKFESDFILDYRIFSGKDGKKGYLRFRLPLYNKDIINPGIYKPSLYDVLKR